MSGVDALDRALLADKAYEAIREFVLDGEFLAGERLGERQLAGRLGVSRLPVREALRRLGEEGLLEEIPHRGRFVRSFTPDDIVDIYNVRLALEPAAIRLVTRMGQPLGRLERSIEAMREAVAHDEIGTLNRLELEFHQAICDLSGNSILSGSFAAIAGRVRLAMSLDNYAYPDRGRIPEEHVPLLEAIASGHEDHAASAIVAHIVSTVDQLFDRMDALDGARARRRFLWPPAQSP